MHARLFIYGIGVLLAPWIAFDKAQGRPANDSLPALQWQVGVATYQAIANQGFQPFYHHYQQGGRIADAHANARIAALLAIQYRFGRQQRWSIRTGAEAIGGYPEFSRMQSVYAHLAYQSFALVVGKSPLSPLSEHLPVPAIGDMGRSNNAPPIPKIGIKTTDLIPLPFFNQRLFALQGALYHGWLEDSRHVKRPYWHEKHLHGRLGSPDTYAALIGGMRHYALWGGQDEEGHLLYPINGHTYYRVFTAQDHDSEANAIGSHLGIIDLALQLYIGEHRGAVFIQKVFEDRGALQWDWSRHDGIIGLRYAPPDNPIKITQIEYSYLSTIWQEGRGIPDPTAKYPDEKANNGWKFGGRDNLYNNYLYRDGYSYQGLLIGNPLLLTYARAQTLNIDVQNYGHFVVSHRLAVHHLTMGFAASSALNLKVHITRVRHYGTYYGLYEGRYEWKGIHTDPNFEYAFFPAKTQWHTQLSAQYRHPKGWNMRISWARDAGELYHVHGIYLSAQYLWGSLNKPPPNPSLDAQ